MSAWTVYWVMQADSICTIATVLLCLFSLTALITGIIAGVMYDSGDRDEAEVMGVAAKRAFFLSMFLLTVAAFLPNTKSMCAILTIPAVVNNETLQADATEIYKLGMERLK